MFATPADTKYEYCSEQIESVIKQAKSDFESGKEKSQKSWALTELIHRTNRKYFNKHMFHHFLFFFTQIPLPFIMEKLLSWINTDVQEVKAGGQSKSFVNTGIFYASMMICLYLIKCTAEISQKYCNAGLFCDSRIMTQSFVINRVTSLKPGSSKYFDISRVTKMLTEDSDIMGSHVYLRANIIVSLAVSIVVIS